MLHLPLADAVAMVERGEIADAKSVAGLLLDRAAAARRRRRVTRRRDRSPWTTSCRSRSRSSCLAGRPSGAARRTRSPPTGATSRGYTALARRARHRRRRRSTRRRSSTSWPNAGPAAAAASSVARQLAAVRMLHRYLVTEGERADDPTADLEGVRVPAGLPKPLTEARVTSLLDAVTGHEPVDLPRPRAARAALRHGRPDLRGVRAVDRRHRLRRPPRAAVRQGLQGAHRAVRAGRRPRRSTSGSRRVGRVLARARRSGGGATTPRRCSSTGAAGG